METEKQHGPQGKEWYMNVYKHAYLKVKTHFHCIVGSFLTPAMCEEQIIKSPGMRDENT